MKAVCGEGQRSSMSQDFGLSLLRVQSLPSLTAEARLFVCLVRWSREEVSDVNVCHHHMYGFQSSDSLMANHLACER